jgi:hypothetical protein
MVWGSFSKKNLAGERRGEMTKVTTKRQDFTPVAGPPQFAIRTRATQADGRKSLGRTVVRPHSAGGFTAFSSRTVVLVEKTVC